MARRAALLAATVLTAVLAACATPTAPTDTAKPSLNTGDTTKVPGAWNGSGT